MLPAFDQGFVDVAFVKLRVPNDGNHAAFGTVLHQPMRFDVVLGKGSKKRLRYAEADGTR